MMNCIKNSVLRHVRLKASIENNTIDGKRNAMKQLTQMMCTSTVSSSDQIMDRVIELVKKFDRIDAAKVTEKADFQKDLSLDSLDRVELVMAFEQEFSIEIPEEKADKLTCCADVANYLASAVEERTQESS